jgi:hypothetical protein
MTTTTQTLQEALAAFDPDGHLGDVTLTCIADGELALVPPSALEHLDQCDCCSRRLGEAALLSVATGDALITMEPRPEARAGLVSAGSVTSLAPAPRAEPRRARRPMPVAAIAAALALVALTAGPSVVDAIQSAPGTIAAALGSVPFLARVGAAFLREAPWGLGDVTLMVQGVTALVMVAVGLQVARVRSRTLAGTNGVNGGEA